MMLVRAPRSNDLRPTGEQDAAIETRSLSPGAAPAPAATHTRAAHAACRSSANLSRQDPKSHRRSLAEILRPRLRGSVRRTTRHVDADTRRSAPRAPQVPRSVFLQAPLAVVPSQDDR